MDLTFPFTFPIYWFGPPAGPAAQSFHTYADWNADGYFSDNAEDIVEDAKSITIEYGRDSELGKAGVGQCRIVVTDSVGKYVYGNTSSEIVVAYGGIYPGRAVRISRVLSGTTYELFNGFIDDILPDPAKSKQEATILCVDGLDQLKRAKISTPLVEDQYSGGSSGLITLALNAAGWDAAKRTISSNQIDEYSAIYVEQQPALAFIGDLEDTEFGFFYIGHDGYAHWEDRHVRLKDDRCTSTQWICYGSSHININPTFSLKSVVNNVVMRGQPKTKATNESQIWYLADNAASQASPYLSAGGSAEFYAEFADADGRRNIAGDVQPVTLFAPSLSDYTDYTSSDIVGNAEYDNGGADRTSGYLSVSTTIYAGSAKIQVTNTHATQPVFITKLRMRGKIYSDDPTSRVEVGDTSSQLAYRRFDSEFSLPYYQTYETMRGLAHHIVSVKKEPVATYEIEMINDKMDVTAAILSRHISDRIGLQNPAFNVSGEFFIEKIRHEITDGCKIHKCWWTVTDAAATGGVFWRLDKSQLESGPIATYAYPTRLAF
jgi:hypothetical protein